MFARPIFRASRLSLRCYATDASTAPPLLLKIRQDMKSAMRNKDSNRLSVLRSILSQTLNASKTASPINTDMQLVALLKKSANSCRSASEEFKAAGRQDLAEKEDLQVGIMEEYAGAVEMLGADEIRSTVQGIVDAMKSEGSKLNIAEVMKKAFSPEFLGDKPVQRGDVAAVVKELLGKP